MWKMFEKAGEPGWASIVPIYNGIILIRLAGKPIWWIVLFLIPCVNVVVSVGARALKRLGRFFVEQA